MGPGKTRIYRQELGRFETQAVVAAQGVPVADDQYGPAGRILRRLSRRTCGRTLPGTLGSL